MNILILGSGGREHAIAWKISQSILCEELFIAPGNAGTNECGKNVDISINDFNSVRAFVLNKNIQLVIVGPEEPLVLGIVDFFLDDNELKNVLIVGPSAEGAKLEGSKDYAKEFMQRHHIPTAAYKTFQRGESEQAIKFLNEMKPPYVLKADGLAAGKGVIITSDMHEATSALKEILENSKFGDAGSKVVIEEFLEGTELSVFVLTDGENYCVLPEAKDYKRIGEGDSGLNTGGMGAVSPVSFATKEFLEKTEERIIRPTISGLKKEKIYYRGFVFIGIMNVNGNPYVIEYNVRMGDPETEVVFPRIKSDVVSLLKSAAAGKLTNEKMKVDQQTALTVILASGGYPESYETGKNITSTDFLDDCKIFHAGTKHVSNNVQTNGGRVMAVTAFGNSIDECMEKCYRQIEKINFEGKYFRKDIGKDLIEMEKKTIA